MTTGDKARKWGQATTNDKETTGGKVTTADKVTTSGKVSAQPHNNRWSGVLRYSDKRPWTTVIVIDRCRPTGKLNVAHTEINVHSERWKRLITVSDRAIVSDRVLEASSS